MALKNHNTSILVNPAVTVLLSSIIGIKKWSNHWFFPETTQAPLLRNGLPDSKTSRNSCNCRNDIYIKKKC